MKNIFKPGFTLIELLVVISVIGILATLLLANFAGVRDRAEDAKIKNNLKQYQTALRMHYNDNQSYPANQANSVCPTLVNYINNADVPSSCKYDQLSSDTFKACATLANTADKDIASSQARCGVVGEPTTSFCVCSN